MKASQLMVYRFSEPPAELTVQTKILGTTAAEWEEARVVTSGSPFASWKSAQNKLVS
jgi:hypothetical protein